MNELLEKILATDVLSESTKAEIASAFTQLVNEQVAAAKEDAANETRAQLVEQWVNEREALIDAMDAQIHEALVREMNELKDDVARFRDLEVEFAGRLVEAKRGLAQELDANIFELAEGLDGFIEAKLREEFTELRESIEQVKKNELGRKVFEMFAGEYQSNFVNKTQVERELAESKKTEAQLKAQLAEAAAQRDEAIRANKIDSLLTALNGKPRAVMETILKTVPTEKLAESYELFLPRVLQESTRSQQPISESNTENTKVVNGNGATQLSESSQPASQPRKYQSVIDEIRALAGTRA